MSASPSDQPLISVALCAYNGERYLREQLDSILAQEDVALEIIAVDDCSADGSLALLQAYAARDPRIRVYENLKNLGHLASFERAMALGSGPLIAPSDQDDRWHPRKLRRLLDALGECDLAYCDSQYIDSDGRRLEGRVSADLQWMHAGRDPLPLVFQNTVSGHAMLVRREVFESARPFPELLYHDWWLALRAACGRGIAYVDEPLVEFRRHATACSPLGRDACQKGAKPRSPSRNRKWLEQLLYVLERLEATDWPVRERAAAWHRALQAAMHDERRALRHIIWRDRAHLSPRGLPGWYAAMKFYLRCRRKIRRASLEPAVSTPLFR